ncbi:outer membrane protein assembly factor BamB family protein [Nocardia niigatensis]
MLGATGGLGCGLVLGGVLLALYSVTLASTLPENWESYQGTDSLNQADGVARQYAWSAIVVGLVVLAAVGVIMFEVVRSHRWEWSTTNWARTAVAVAIGAGVVVLPVMAVTGHLVRRYQKIRGDLPSFASLPAAVTASGLVMAGAVLLGILVWRSMIPLWRPGVKEALSMRRGLGIAVAVGLVASGVVAVVAVRVADDTVRFDHALAGSTMVASVPNRLGEERYRVPLAMVTTSDGMRSPDVVVAGAGFVVASTAGVTAYDGATGAPRWHYLSTYPPVERSVPWWKHDTSTRVGLSPGTLQSVDGGRVVMAHWNRVGWNAFDAITGEILWHHSDYTRDIAELDQWSANPDETRPTSGILIRHNSERVARYDGRTGTRMWSVNVDASSCPERQPIWITTDASIYLLARCAHHDPTRAILTEIDPATGAVVGTREFDHGEDPMVERFQNTVVINWAQGAPGVERQLILTGPRQLATARGDDSGHPSLIAAADPDGAQQIRPVYRDPHDHDPFAVVAADTGAMLYRLPGFSDEIGLDTHNVAFLRDEIVQAPNSIGSRTLTYQLQAHSWSRDDGHPVISQPVATVPYQAIPYALAAPGAVLVFCRGQSAGELVGYGG